MEEIYILPDGSNIDISDYSELEKLTFLVKNPKAKKQKGATGSATVAPAKNKAQKKSTVSRSVDGSSAPKKFRLATEADLEAQQNKGKMPPPSSQPRVPTEDYNYLYDLAKNKPKPSVLETQKVQLPGQRTSSKLKGKIGGSKEEIDDFVENFRDNPVTGEIGLDNQFKIQKAKEKIQLTDSELDNPYMYYSSVNQEQPDNFVKDNYDIAELEKTGFNIQNFDGFLNKKGYKADYLDKEAKGLFQGEGRGLSGYDIGLAKELAKKKLLTMYMEDMQQRDFTKQDLNQDIEIAAGFRKEKQIVKNQLFDQQGVAKYVEKNFPIMTQTLKDRDKENAKLYQESKKGGSDFFSWETPGKMVKAGWNAVTDRIAQVSSTVYDVVGLDTTAEGIRMLDEENKFVKPIDRGVSYASGKTVEYDGTKYIVDSKGEIYDADAKIRVTDLFDDNLHKKLIEESKYGSSDWIFSGQGAAVQTSGVMADMLLQAAATSGVGSFGAIVSASRATLVGTGRASKFTALLNDTSQLLRKVPLDRGVGYSMIAQGALGYSQGYEETLKAARDNGINDAQAFKLANAAAQRMAVLYSTTGVINPQVNVAENVFGSKNIIKKAIDQYMKVGEKGFVSYIDDIIKSTPRNLIEFAEEGGKEVIQENTQQIGEIGVNKMTNRDAGKKIMNDVMSGDDFMNTSILSFISSGLISKAKLPSFKRGDESFDDLRSLNTLAKNKKEFTKSIDDLVAKKVFTKEESDNLKSDVDVYSNNINKLMKTTPPDAAMPIMRELDKVTKLTDEKQTVDKAFHGQIDEKIEAIRANMNKIYYESELKVKNEAIEKAIKKGVAKGVSMKSLSTTQEVQSYLVNELGMPKETAEMYSEQPGFALNSETLKKYSKDPNSISDKSQVIVVNESLTRDAGVIQHEFLHGVLQNTLKDSPEAQKLVGKALATEIRRMNDELVLKGSSERTMPDWFIQRMKQYTDRDTKSRADATIEYKMELVDAKGDPSKIAAIEAKYKDKLAALEGVVWEEALTIYSDALRRGYVTYKESTFTKLGDVIRRVLQRLGIKDIKFNSGKDVYNFIKDYNNSVETGNWGKALTKMSNKGAEINIKPEGAKKVEPVKPKPEFSTTEKFSLGEKKSSENIKKDVNKTYDKEKWSVGSTRGRDENPAIERVLFDILGEYDYIIRGKAKTLGFANVPGYNDLDMISETYVQLIPHIRNFNKEFFKKREEYKKELQEKGLDPNSKEFKDKVEAQDEKGYKGKSGIVKENDDLNAWINSQLVNKMNGAMKSGNVSEQVFSEDIEGEMFKESKISDGFQGDDSYLKDYEDSVFEVQDEFEAQQDKLAVLLRDPVFRFVDEKGVPVQIETIPFGGLYISSASDKEVPANVKLKTETDPVKIAELKKELKDLERGLELKEKKDITFEEKEELKKLQSFKSFDLSSGDVINTFKALSTLDTPTRIVVEDVAEEILRSPNIQTLEYRNFKENLSDRSKTMMKRITFEHGPGLESLMYNEWKLIYDVINHPMDPVTGQSSYASKKLPPTLKEFDDKGRLKKIGDITRVKFLQAYYKVEEATNIIKKYGGKNAAKELKQLEPEEVNKVTGQPLAQNTHFDRRTALRELFGDVMVLQEARRLIRDPQFLERVAERQVNLYNDLKDDVIRAEVLKDLSRGKSDIVKFSLAEEENGKLSPFLKGLPFTKQWLVARDIEKAISKAKMSSSAQQTEIDKLNAKISKTTDPVKIKELKEKISDLERFDKVTFKVPSKSELSDEAIAYFIISKVAEGYNDFEFRVKKNASGPLTKQVLDNLDFKSKKAAEIRKLNSNLEEGMNQIIEENTGVEAAETFSPETAKNLGKNIGKYDIFLPPEDEDFLGLLYTLASGKGKKGEEQMNFLKRALIEPYTDAMLKLMKARQVMYKDWRDLINKKHKGITKVLKTDSGYGGYLNDQAVRVYLWRRAGYDIPGLDKKDIFNLQEIVRKNPELRKFAEDVSLLSKQANGYIEPDSNWGFGSVVSDINNIISKSSRQKYLEPWTSNVEKVFSKDNLSKIEALYGRKYVIALKNTLDRMKTGTNRAEGSSDAFLNWLNGATAVTMFLNTRSAVLQTIGAVNYINTSDNNIVKAGLALLNVPQYTKDFFTLWNSDYLKDRRSGLTTDVVEAELAQTMNDPRNKSMLDKFKAVNYLILKFGFNPTRYADSFAIAFGGAGFYRNRLNTYKKQGMAEQDAINKTLRDFYDVSEVSQQSADVSKISMNQASTKGRILLSFMNTPFQYSRLIKKSAIDIIKGRGSIENNLAKIVYYGAVQNMLFNALQNALFSMFLSDDEEQKSGKFDTAKIRTINGALDTFVRGMGMKGVFLSTLKNALMKAYEKKKDPKGYGDVLAEIANLSPSIGIKVRALVKSYKAVTYNLGEIKYKGFSIDNSHAIEAATSLTSAMTNLPVDRLYMKIQNIGNALDDEFKTWQRIAFLFGYNEWNLNPGKTKQVNASSSGGLKIPVLKTGELKQPGLKTP